MKKIMFLLAGLALCIGAANAQKLNGSLDVLKGATQVNVQFDYTGIVWKLNKAENEAGFVADKLKESDGEEWVAWWEEYKKSVTEGDCYYDDFIKEMDEVFIGGKKELRTGRFPEADYTFTVRVSEVNTGLNAGPFSFAPWAVCTVDLTRTGSTEVLATIDMGRTTGWPFNNIEGMVETAFESVGEDLAKFLTKKIK